MVGKGRDSDGKFVSSDSSVGPGKIRNWIEDWWNLFHAVKQDLEKKRRLVDNTSGRESKQVSVIEERIRNGRNILYKPFEDRNNQFVVDLIKYAPENWAESVVVPLEDIQKKRRDDHNYEVIGELGYMELKYLIETEEFLVEAGAGKEVYHIRLTEKKNKAVKEKLREAEQMKEESDERLDQHQKDKKIIEEFTKGRFDKVEEEIAHIRKTLQLVLDRQLERLGKEEQIKAEKSALSTAKYLWNFLTGMSIKHNIPSQIAA